MAIDLSHRFSDESERPNEDIYNDSKLMKTHLVAMFFYKLIQHDKVKPAYGQYLVLLRL